MASFARVRTARREHRCSRCRYPIKPGSRYQEWTLTPGGELGYQGWKRERVHETYDDCFSEPCKSTCARFPDDSSALPCCMCEVF